MNYILLIIGSSESGKSSISQKIAKQSAKGVHIPVDDLRTGSGQLKKKVLRFLNKPHIKNNIIGWRKTIKISVAYLSISSNSNYQSNPN